MVEFTVGMKISSYEEIQTMIADYERNNFCNLKIRESRTLQNVRVRIKKNFNELLIYYEIKYVCFFGPLYKKRSTGERKGTTYKGDCPFSIVFRVGDDGQFLEIKSLNMTHNHACDSVIFNHLPDQRKLNLSDKYISDLLALGANKRLLQVKINNETGKNITLKSLHNIKKSNKILPNTDASVVTNILSNKYNCDVRILKNDDNFVCGLFFVDNQMKRTLEFFPELMLIDATYKLLDSR